MNNDIHNLPNGSGKNTGKKTKKNEAQRLFDILNGKPISRRMAATLLGYEDQTFMVTQSIYDWIEEGKVQVIGLIKCERSGQFVQGVTNNPKYFTKPTPPTQFYLFDS
jgi:hypothetical protein